MTSNMDIHVFITLRIIKPIWSFNYKFFHQLRIIGSNTNHSLQQLLQENYIIAIDLCQE